MLKLGISVDRQDFCIIDQGKVLKKYCGEGCIHRQIPMVNLVNSLY